MAGEQMHADVEAIKDYAGATQRAAMDGMSKTVTVASHVNEASMRAFARGSGGDVFAGGLLMNNLVTNNSAVFAQFLGDVTQGLTAIANAAQVCADAYRTSDVEAADTIGLVDFAFADPAATRPRGLAPSIGQTLSQQAQVQVVATPPITMAADEKAKPVSVFARDDYSSATFGDGSSRVVRTTYINEGPLAGTIVTETTIVAPGAAPVVASRNTYLSAGGRVLETHTEGPTTTVTKTEKGKVTVTVEANGKQIGDAMTFDANADDATSTKVGPVTDTLAALSEKDKIGAMREATSLPYVTESVGGP